MPDQWPIPDRGNVIDYQPVTEALERAAKVFQERNEVYGDAYLKVGPIMAALFPEGLKLKTDEDHNRYHLLMLIVVKLTRYAPNFAGGHEDSMSDIMTYAAMIQGLDKQVREREAEEREWA